MNVLLTGVHGFVGSNLVVSLGREHRLFGLDIVSPEKEGIVKTYSWNDLEPDNCRPSMQLSIWQERRTIQKNGPGRRSISISIRA